MVIVTQREKLFDLLRKYINDDYSIGFHGVAKYRLDGKTHTSISYVIENVLKDGLNINDQRTLLGTTQFLDDNYFTDEQDFVTRYKYGDVKEYIVVALPKFITNSKGDKLYLGHPTYKKTNQPQGYQITSLADLLLPMYSSEQSKLPTEFILGKLDIESACRFKPNPNHMSLNGTGNKVSDEIFNKCLSMLNKANNFYGVDESFQVTDKEDALLNVEIIEEEFDRLQKLTGSELKEKEDELQKLDYQTRMVITAYPNAIRNTFDEYIKENNNKKR